MDLYRLMGGLGALTILWLVQIVGLNSFRQEDRRGPPKVQVVDVERDFKGADANRPLVEIARERHWVSSTHFASAEKVAQLNSEYLRKKWLTLAVGLAGALGTVLLARHLWESWPLALLAVLLGPVIAFVGYANQPVE
jgi:hypothetical protein